MVVLPRPSGNRGNLLHRLNWPPSLINWRSMQILQRPSNKKKLRLLVHKPTFACTANCVACENRRQLHRASRRGLLMTHEQHLELYRQAARLGVSELHISGGEPTLYKRLPELVEEAKRLGWFVMLNTNGSQLVRQDLLDSLFRAGLDGVMLSLYSHREEVHDGIRRQKGLWQRAMHGLGQVERYRRERNPAFFIVTQSILARDNLFDAADLLDLVGRQGSDVHLFSYIEGDFQARYVPTVEMIARFRHETVPAMRRVITRLPEVNPVMRTVGWWQVGRFFNGKNSDANYARCIYHETEKDYRRCTIPNEFMLALPDGNIHPCNVVEYSHEPVVGNFLQNGQDLAAIWDGEIWNRFREERHHWCRRCPMTYHTWVPLNLTFGRLARLLRGRV